MTKLRLGLIVALSFLVFWHLDTWFTPNPSSRAMLVASIVESGTYHVDRYQAWSEDKAFVRGHYYSDKAPLSSWVTVPAYLLASRIFGVSSGEGLHPAVLICGSIMCGVLPTVFLLVLLFGILREKGASPLISVLYIAGAIPCSMIGVYSGTFFGHILAGLLLSLAWRAHFHKSSFTLAGVFLGLSCLAEFPLLLFAPFFLLHALVKTGPQRRQAALYFFLGLAPALILLVAHNLLTTGQPLEFAYKHVDSPSFQHMKLFYGFRLPSSSALWGLLFSPAHGLLFHAPIVVVLGAAFFLQGSQHLKSACLHLGSWALISFLLLVSSYQMWEGGWAFGPRHLIPLLMVLLVEGAALVPTRSTLAWSWSLSAVCYWGGALVFLAKSTAVYMVPTWLKFPVKDLFLPKFLQGEFNPNVVVSWLFPVSPRMANILWANVLVAVLGYYCWRAIQLENNGDPSTLSPEKKKG